MDAGEEIRLGLSVRHRTSGASWPDPGWMPRGALTFRVEGERAVSQGRSIRLPTASEQVGHDVHALIAGVIEARQAEASLHGTQQRVARVEGLAMCAAFRP